ncbi:MAG: LytTR family DNA-binding domain-containing protein [Bacteroidota bacterium]
MKVLIVEDEQPAAEKLQRYLQQYDSSIELLAVLTSVEETVRFLQRSNARPDLIFMDIQLTDGLSFEVFDQVDIQQPVVFTTAFDEFAIDAFKVNSIDFILKPLTFTALSKALKKLASLTRQLTDQQSIHRAIDQIKTQKYKDRFLVKMGNRIHSISSADAACFYADGRTVYLLTRQQRKFILDYKLEALEQLLDPCVFHRVNRTFIIRIDAIADILVHSNQRLHVELQVPTEKEIIVSRDKVAAFKEWLRGE